MTRTFSDPLPKGLVVKWAIRPHSSPEAAKECFRLHAFKIEYAQDDEGRIWRRIHRETRFRGRAPWQRFTEVVRWHIADMYEWFPGADPATISGARPQNTRARPPKNIDVYLIDDKPVVLMRPCAEFPSV